MKRYAALAGLVAGSIVVVVGLLFTLIAMMSMGGVEFVGVGLVASFWGLLLALCSGGALRRDSRRGITD